MHQPRIELGAQQASVAQGWANMGMLDFATKPLVQAMHNAEEYQYIYPSCICCCVPLRGVVEQSTRSRLVEYI